MTSYEVAFKVTNLKQTSYYCRRA